MVENPGKLREGPQQITRLVQDGPPQLMVENLGKWQEGPHWFLRTTNKMAPLGATKYWKKKIPITSFIIVSCPWFLLFCFVLYHQSWRLTYTQTFKNIVVFGLKNGGRLIHELTYTRENMVVPVTRFIHVTDSPFCIWGSSGSSFLCLCGEIVRKIAKEMQMPRGPTQIF